MMAAKVIKNSLNINAQRYCLLGLSLCVSLVWGVQNAIDDEAFLLFLADSVPDDSTETGLVDPLHMIEPEWIDHMKIYEKKEIEQESDSSNQLEEGNAE